MGVGQLVRRGEIGAAADHESGCSCAERVLLPAVRGADPQTAILADGFSCRTQIEQLGGCGRRAVHLAQLLASADGPGPSDGAAA